MRLVQHKREAYWFYRFLSIFYDQYVNPLFWTEPMREASLDLARLDNPGLTIVDVGSGTGFTTEGIVRRAPARQVTCLDQSPHQMRQARKKEALQDCTFQLGDAENLPFPTDHFDRYVSAGSIEYWPNPQQGIAEAYRVIKPGGIALMIGPLEPGNALSRFLANTWMLFPKEEEYRTWFERAGFENIEVRYVAPHWHRGKEKYGIALAGRKPAPGPSPAAAKTGAEKEPEKMGPARRLQLAGRVLLGSLAGFAFIPLALLGHAREALRGGSTGHPGLNRHQVGALLFLVGLAVVLVWLIAN